MDFFSCVRFFFRLLCANPLFTWHKYIYLRLHVYTSHMKIVIVFSLSKHKHQMQMPKWQYETRRTGWDLISLRLEVSFHFSNIGMLSSFIHFHFDVWKSTFAHLCEVFVHLIRDNLYTKYVRRNCTVELVSRFSESRKQTFSSPVESSVWWWYRLQIFIYYTNVNDTRICYFFPYLIVLQINWIQRLHFHSTDFANGFKKKNRLQNNYHIPINIPYGGHNHIHSVEFNNKN